MTSAPRPQRESAAVRKVARRNVGGTSTLAMLANTTRVPLASVSAFRRIAWASMFWTFVDAAQMSDGEVRIDGKQGHHLARVLRVRPGEGGVAVCGGLAYQPPVGR